MEMGLKFWHVWSGCLIPICTFSGRTTCNIGGQALEWATNPNVGIGQKSCSVNHLRNFWISTTLSRSIARKLVIEESRVNTESRSWSKEKKIAQPWPGRMGMAETPSKSLSGNQNTVFSNCWPFVFFPQSAFRRGFARRHVWCELVVGNSELAYLWLELTFFFKKTYST